MSAAQEITRKLQENEIFTGMTIDYGQQANGIEWVDVRFNGKDFAEAKAILDAFGFKTSLFGGHKRFAPDFPSIRENYEKMTNEQKAAADKLFEEMVRGR